MERPSPDDNPQPGRDEPGASAPPTRRRAISRTGRHRSADPETTPIDRGTGPVAEIGDSWLAPGSENSWFPAAPPSEGRGRATKIAIGGGAFVAVALVVAIAFPRGSGNPVNAERSAGPPFPPALVPTVSTEPSQQSGGPPSPTAGVHPSSPVRRVPSQPAPATGAPPGPTLTVAPTVWTTLTIQATWVLNKGESVQTNRTRLAMQTDGDLVIIDENNSVRWRSGTAGHGHHATFQDDGHFVVYDTANIPWWQSRTAGHNGAVLVLQADGDVCIVDRGTVIWHSQTAH
jgi:hypothetical protein